MRDLIRALAASVLVASLCLMLWTLGIKAEVMSLQAPEPPEPPIQAVHFLPTTSARIVPGLSGDARGAYMLLANAGSFVSRYAGASHRPSPYARDLDLLAADPTATDAFLALLRHGSPAGQVYGLCGLYLTNLSRFLEERDRMRTKGDTLVNLLIGCSARQARLSTVATEVGMGCSALGL